MNTRFRLMMVDCTAVHDFICCFVCNMLTPFGCHSFHQRPYTIYDHYGLRDSFHKSGFKNGQNKNGFNSGQTSSDQKTPIKINKIYKIKTESWYNRDVIAMLRWFWALHALRQLFTVDPDPPAHWPCPLNMYRPSSTTLSIKFFVSIMHIHPEDLFDFKPEKTQRIWYQTWREHHSFYCDLGWVYPPH